MEMLLAWLERYSPATRLFIVAVVPALFVFLLEEATRPKIVPPPPVAVVKPEPPLVHVFSSLDLNDVHPLSTKAKGLLKQINESLDKVHTAPNETICLNQLRYGVYNYISDMLARLDDNIMISINMQKAPDEDFVNQSIMETLKSTIGNLPALQIFVTSMNNSCPKNNYIASWGAQIRPFLTQTEKTLKALELRARKHETDKLKQLDEGHD